MKYKVKGGGKIAYFQGPATSWLFVVNGESYLALACRHGR
jgi:hypothetical protein